VRSPRFSWVLHVAAILAWASVAVGATRHVPAEYATINQALDASSPGDSVLVAPGVYEQYETRILGDGFPYTAVGFLKGGVVLASEAGAESTILRSDPPGGARHILLAFGDPGTAIVEGFTITGTTPHLSGASYGYGGLLVLQSCIFCDLGTGLTDEGAAGTVMADLQVYGCRFENINGASGSGIDQTSGTLLVEDSEFVSCRSGAVSLKYDDSFPHATGATVRRCRFVDNVSTTGGSAGLSVAFYSSVLVEDCWFEGNHASSPGNGGAVAAAGASSQITIRDNTFVGNTVELGHGGAVRVTGVGSLVVGNTFWANAMGLDWSEGGSSVYFERSGELRNNVLAGSEGANAAGVLSGSVQTSCNVFWANALGNASFPLSESDLEADPMFCDVDASDFTVSAGSPCLPGNGHPSCTELIGAWGLGCGVIAVDPTSWGRLKSEFRSEVRR
jgi:hypothetical protein